MGGWRPVERRLARVALLALAAGGSVHGQDTGAEVTGFLEEGRYGEALRAAERMIDPGARAEWRFHVLYTGGDLPGAFAAAREGLAADPDHPRLLENAARAATNLGLGHEAASLARRLAGLEGLDAESAERARGLLEEAEGIEDLERRGRAGVRRARLVALMALGGAVLGLGLLARG